MAESLKRGRKSLADNPDNPIVKQYGIGGMYRSLRNMADDAERYLYRQYKQTGTRPKLGADYVGAVEELVTLRDSIDGLISSIQDDLPDA